MFTFLHVSIVAIFHDQKRTVFLKWTDFRTIFSHSRSEQFRKQNTIFRVIHSWNGWVKNSLLACHVHFSSCIHRSHISWPKKKAGKITGRPEFINRCERRAKTHHHHYHQKIPSLGRLAWALDTFQDILIMLGIKPHLHILKISVFTLNNLILRLTKNMEKSWQKLGTFFVNEVLKKSKFFKTFH